MRSLRTRRLGIAFVMGAIAAIALATTHVDEAKAGGTPPGQDGGSCGPALPVPMGIQWKEGLDPGAYFTNPVQLYNCETCKPPIPPPPPGILQSAGYANQQVPPWDDSNGNWFFADAYFSTVAENFWQANQGPAAYAHAQAYNSLPDLASWDVGAGPDGKLVFEVAEDWPTEIALAWAKHYGLEKLKDGLMAYFYANFWKQGGQCAAGIAEKIGPIGAVNLIAEVAILLYKTYYDWQAITASVSGERGRCVEWARWVSTAVEAGIQSCNSAKRMTAKGLQEIGRELTYMQVKGPQPPQPLLDYYERSCEFYGGCSGLLGRNQGVKELNCTNLYSNARSYFGRLMKACTCM